MVLDSHFECVHLALDPHFECVHLALDPHFEILDVVLRARCVAVHTFLFYCASSWHIPGIPRSKLAVGFMPSGERSSRLTASAAPPAHAFFTSARTLARVWAHFTRSDFFCTSPWPG